MFLTWLFAFIGMVAFLFAVQASTPAAFSISTTVAAGCFACLVVDVILRLGGGD